MTKNYPNILAQGFVANSWELVYNTAHVRNFSDKFFTKESEAVGLPHELG